MRALGLSRRTAVIFVVLEAIALGVLVYAGWRIGSGASGPNAALSPSPTLAAPGPVGIRACASPEPGASPAAGTVFEADRFTAGDRGARGLAYLPSNRSLLVGRDLEAGVQLESFTLFGDRAGTRFVEIAPVNDLAMDRASERSLFALDASGTSVEVVALAPDPPDTAVTHIIDLRATGVSRFTGLDMDESTSSIVLVDPALDRMLRVTVRELRRGTQRPWEVAAACSLPLPVLRDAEDVAIAVRPGDGAILLAEEGGAVLHELTPTGVARATYDLSAIGIGGVRGLAFAPSADPTDADGTEHLYILDEQPRGTEVAALTFEAPTDPAPEAPTLTASVVQSIDVAAADPPSSDPGGVAFDAGAERVIVTDSDIDEIPEFAGSVVFARATDGTWVGLGMPAELHEVTDVALDPDGNRWFFTDDGLDLVVAFDLGPDGNLGTRDDRASRVDTTTFGNGDPEGLTFGQGSLFITDGDGAEIYRLMPGPDGKFGGVHERSDDSVTSFDTAVHGVSDPEGVAYDASRGTLYVLGRDQREPIIEVGTDGRLIRRIVVPEGVLVSPGGIAVLPPTADGNVRLLIADRGEDNARSAAPNDGRLVEIEVPPPAPPG